MALDEPSRTVDAFISYNGMDVAFVKTVVDALKRAGLHIWIDVSEIKGGERWVQPIESVLLAAPAFLACIGQVAPDRWCRDEIEVALIRKKRDPAFRIIPLLLAGADLSSIPPFLAIYSAIRVSDPSDEVQVTRVVNAIRGSLPNQTRIEWPAIFLEAGRTQVASEVAALRNKYIALTYTSRVRLDCDVAEFFESDAQTLLLLGEAGVGKTNFVCRLAEEQSRERPVFLFRAATLSTEASSLEHAIADVVEAYAGLRHGHPLFPALKRTLQGTRMLVIVDAINEATNLVGCLEMIAGSLQHAKAAPVQFCLTCRRSDWRFFRDDTRLTDSLWRPIGKSETAPHGLVIERFTDGEADEAWSKYRSYFHIAGELETEVREICKQPLMMRFVCEAFKDRDVPSSLNTMDVFDRYWNFKIGQDPRRSTALFSIVLEFRRRRVSTLQEGTVTGLVDLDVYNALLSEDIILYVRIDPYARVRIVGFMYEAFFEYCLARAILSVEGWDENDPQAPIGLVSALLDEAHDNRMIVGVVEFVILHFQEHERLGEMLDHLERSSEWKQRCCTLLPRLSHFDGRFAARLSRLADDQDYWVRWAASFATAQLGVDEDLDDLVKNWSDRSSWPIRESAANVYAWRTITRERWEHTLILAADPYWRVRRALANSINQHLSRKTLELDRLSELLHDASWRRRDVGIIAQRDLAIAPAVSRKLLDPLIEDANERVRFSVAKFAGTLPTASDFVPLLSQLATDSSAWVRKRVATSIVHFAATDSVGTLRVLALLSVDPVPSVRWEVARVLGRVPPDVEMEADRFVASLERDAAEGVRHAAAFTRKRRAGVLPHDFEETLGVVAENPLDVREAIARVVGLIQPPRHFDQQRSIVGAWKADYYLGIVRAIRLAHEKLGWDRFDNVLNALLDDPEEGVRWALAQNTETLPIALDRRISITVALLTDPNVWVRQAMIEEVPSPLVQESGEIRGRLLAMVEDPDADVRLALALAVVRLRKELGAQSENILQALRQDPDAEIRRLVGETL